MLSQSGCGGVKLSWTSPNPPPPGHPTTQQRVTEGCPEARPVIHTLIIMRTQPSDSACVLQRGEWQTQTRSAFIAGWYFCYGEYVFTGQKFICSDWNHTVKSNVNRGRGCDWSQSQLLGPQCSHLCTVRVQPDKERKRSWLTVRRRVTVDVEV